MRGYHRKVLTMMPKQSCRLGAVMKTCIRAFLQHRVVVVPLTNTVAMSKYVIRCCKLYVVVTHRVLRLLRGLPLGLFDVIGVVGGVRRVLAFGLVVALPRLVATDAEIPHRVRREDAQLHRHHDRV